MRRPSAVTLNPTTPRPSLRARAGSLAVLAGLAFQLIGLATPLPVAADQAASLTGSLYHGNTGSSFQGFNGQGSPYPNPQNLTQYGTGDWRLWGAANSSNGTSLDGIRKTNGDGISQLQLLNPNNATFIQSGGTRPFTFQWSNGNGPASGSGVLAGVNLNNGGVGSGFRLTVPAPNTTSPQTLMLWVSVFDGTAQLAATLPGAQTYTDTSMVGKTNDHGGIYTLTFNGPPTANLQVDFTLLCPNGPCPADSKVTMYAAAWTGPSSPPAFSVGVTSGSQPSWTLTQGDITPRTSSVSVSVVHAPIGAVTLSAQVTDQYGANACDPTVLDPSLKLCVALGAPTPSSTPPYTSTVTITPGAGLAAGTYLIDVGGT
ncbi:MAG TPA: hypothetical protein VFP19_00755, partial [Candidatus Limnocylindrales bacterium]|nr:hypothetical protein [Candidatus Limnocylindrales bacterium]